MLLSTKNPAMNGSAGPSLDKAREVHDPDSTEHAIIQQPRFSPYVNNGGTVLGVAGKDFCVMASDTRISTGYSIQSRNGCKMYEMSSSCVLTTSGMQADMSVLFKMLRVRTEQYKHAHQKEMSVGSVAQMLANTLYGRRFFPYYTFNVLGGLDENGEGAVYSYDAVGSFERINYNAAGSGSALVLPLLDNQVGGHNMVQGKGDLTLEEAIDLVKDAMTSAGERDIYTGDMVDIAIITKDGVRREKFALKAD